jgi:hypothetical protein
MLSEIENAFSNGGIAFSRAWLNSSTRASYLT